MCFLGEFYVRAKGTTRPYTGDYWLAFKRHTCSSQAEACILHPGERQQAVLTKAGDPIGLQNQASFRFAVTGTSKTAGIDQTITLTADGLTDPNNHKATLQSFTNTNGMSPPVTQAAGAKSGVRQPDGRWLKRLSGDRAGPAWIRPGKGRRAAGHQHSLPRRAEPDLRGRDKSRVRLGRHLHRISRRRDYHPVIRARAKFEFDCDEPRDEKAWAPHVGKPTITFVNDVGVRVLEEDNFEPRRSEPPADGSPCSGR